MRKILFCRINSRTMSENENKNVFIVHGHNKLILNEVKEFIITLGLTPTILHEQPNSGLTTIIDKFERYAKRVNFAVILLTYDDEGHELGPQQIITIDKEKSLFSLKREKGSLIVRPWSENQPRARQNVIFEFGYFIALLGRTKVVALCENGIERPSDIDGVIYIPYNPEGGWKDLLAQDIEEAGLAIKYNQ